MHKSPKKIKEKSDIHDVTSRVFINISTITRNHTIAAVNKYAAKTNNMIMSQILSKAATSMLAVLQG